MVSSHSATEFLRNIKNFTIEAFDVSLNYTSTPRNTNKNNSQLKYLNISTRLNKEQQPIIVKKCYAVNK